MVSPNSTATKDPTAIGRWLLVSLSSHEIKVLEDGSTVRTITEFSTGREGHLTPLETDAQIDSSRRFRHHSSSLYQNKGGKPAEMPFALFFDGACAFHQGDPKVDSHGCIHLGPANAAWLFNWVGVHEVHVRISGPRLAEPKPA